MMSHSHSAATDASSRTGGAQAVPSRLTCYVGSDWMFTADASAQYDSSEAMGAFLILAEPGHELELRTADVAQPLHFHAVAHPAGAISEIADKRAGGLFLHFDPISDAGRALARIANAHASATPWTPPAAAEWSAAWFARLLNGAVSPGEIAAWVKAIQDGLVLDAGTQGNEVGRQLQIVAEHLGRDPGGRLDCQDLASKVGWSPAYLRRVFRNATGMTMSRYQAWRRMHLTFLLTSESTGERSRRGITTSMLHEAGFYDAPHGFRAIRQYLGMDAAEALHPCMFCEISR